MTLQQSAGITFLATLIIFFVALLLYTAISNNYSIGDILFIFVFTSTVNSVFLRLIFLIIEHK